MTLYDYAGMLARTDRIGPFRHAIERAVRPGMAVLDLGTGLGTYAMFAARAGARHVTAIDADRIVRLAESLALRNGLADTIDFVLGRAPADLPEIKFDVVVFEDYPTNFLDSSTHRLLSAVESRHLAPGGRLIPGGVRLNLAAVVTGEWALETVLRSVRSVPAGIDWSELEARLANGGRKVALGAADVLPDWSPGERMPILPTPSAAALDVSGEWMSDGRAVVALALWFDLDLGEGVWVSNRPAERAEPWGQYLLPVHPPLTPSPGAAVAGRVWREASEDGGLGWMGWSCEAEGQVSRGHELAGVPLSLDDVVPRRGAAPPGPD